MNKFIILSTQRSGSTFLQALLNSHSQIESDVELFLPKNENKDGYASYRRDSLRRRALHLMNRNVLIRDYLENFYVNRSSVNAKGFKFMYGQARRFPEVASWCKAADVRVIHLIRRNSLKMIVSRKVAKTRGVYHSTKPLDTIKVRINCRSLITQLKEIESHVEKYRNIFSYGSYMEVFYEPLVAGTAEEAGRILNFLDIEADEPLTTDLKKINPNSLADLIENYQEVSDTLSGSAFESFLDEPESLVTSVTSQAAH